MGLCRGPIDELVQITVGDKSAWVGSQTAEGSFDINNYELFGGDKREGGIQGQVDFMPGHATQGVNARLAAMLGGLVPAFRGVSTMFFDGIICAMNPYPKSWKMRVRRSHNGWDGDTWYPEKVTINLRNDHIDMSDQSPDPGWREYLRNIKAMNPAHILFELATNRSWSRGFPRYLIDEASYKVAADQLYDEGFGLCIKWARSDSVTALIQTVLDHIGGAQYIDRSTGLLTLKLIRDDYDVESLPLFTPTSGLLGIDDDDGTAADLSANEVVVKWHDPVSDKDGQVREQNLASIQAQDAINSMLKEYPGLPTSELAHRVALRDLRVFSSGLKRYKVRLDRSGRKIAPSSVFRISDPTRGLVNLVLRAGDIDDGKLTDGVITVTALQDVFGLPATGLAVEQPGTWSPPDTTARPIEICYAAESTFRAVVGALGISDATARPVDACYVGTVAVAPSALSLSYLLQTKPDGAPDFVQVSAGGWCPSAKLSVAVNRSPSTTEFRLAGATKLETVVVGGTALIDDEIVRVDAIDLVSDVVTVARGCVDTIPAIHAAGARIWFYESGIVADRTEYLPGETVTARLVTRTSSQQLDDDRSTTTEVLTQQRQGRPYPPGDVKVNGLLWFESFPFGADAVLTWAHRDRITQQDQVVDHAAGSIGPEAGVTYSARVYNGSGVLVVTYANITGTTWTYTTTQRAEDGITDRFSIKFTSVRAGLESLFPYQLDSASSTTGLGLGLGLSLGGI